MSWPQFSEVTDDALKLPYNKKLELLEKDAQSLYEFCLEKGLSSAQLKTCISPLAGKRDSIIKRIKAGSLKSIYKLSILVAVVSVLLSWPSAYYMLNVHLKLLSIKAIPYWDWTSFYEEDCLINNPFLPEQKMGKEDCIGCTDFTKYRNIDRLKNVNITDITDILYADWPFIVTDPVKDWPRDEKSKLLLNLDKIKELYLTHESLKGLKDCEFFATMEEIKNVHQFVDLVDKKALPEKFHAAWDNCEPKAAKVFRLVTKRPYFLPAMVEASQSNQLIVARGNFEPDVFQIPQQADSASWMIVLSGKMEVVLSPREECIPFKCKETSFEVNAGEAIVVPASVWAVQYIPISEGLTLAFTSSVLWDINNAA